MLRHHSSSFLVAQGDVKVLSSDEAKRRKIEQMQEEKDSFEDMEG